MVTFYDSFLFSLQFVGPIIVLALTMFIMALICSILFQKILPGKIFDFLLPAVCLFGFYLWAFPMQLGFYELFK